MSIVNSNNFLHKTVDGVKQFFSPLVNAATVVLKDGTRLEKDGKIHANSADDSKKLNGKPSAYYTPYTNLADNSDFERWVAQAGIGGNHGTQAYGGDRWILTNGTITDSSNSDGDGYSNIKLNGTLVQVVPSPPDVATAFVEMVSGTATISYNASKGEITLTSNGGVIKNVLLLEGEWAEKPGYVPKGYAAELAECRRYYNLMPARLSNIASNIGYVPIAYTHPITMIINPTATKNTGLTLNIDIYGVGAMAATIDNMLIEKEMVYMVLSVGAEHSGKLISTLENIALSADL